ncbi:unnamed protein product, partial [Discosporangium mesarthrocarpum]
RSEVEETQEKLDQCGRQLQDLNDRYMDTMVVFDHAGETGELAPGVVGSLGSPLGSSPTPSLQEKQEQATPGEEAQGQGGESPTPYPSVNHTPETGNSVSGAVKGSPGYPLMYVDVGGPHKSAEKAATTGGPNKEVLSCSLTMPLIRVELSRSKKQGNARTRQRLEEQSVGIPGKDGWEDDKDKEQEEQEEEEEEGVVAMKLVGLGVRLHSRSYDARLSMSMKEAHLEDCLSTQNIRASNPAAPFVGEDSPFG